MYSAFTPLAGGQLSTYMYGSESPFDFDAGLDFTRPQRTFAVLPHAPMIGYIDGLCPMFDAVEYASMGTGGKNPTGPYMGVAPNLAAIFPNISGGLSKVTG